MKQLFQITKEAGSVPHCKRVSKWEGLGGDLQLWTRRILSEDELGREQEKKMCCYIG